MYLSDLPSLTEVLLGENVFFGEFGFNNTLYLEGNSCLMLFKDLPKLVSIQSSGDSFIETTKVIVISKYE